MFRAASVIVCPYLDASQSGVVLTAYAFERPVVASEVGGLGDYVIPDHTGLLVGPGDAPALARALTEILTDHPKRARLAAGAKAVGRETLSWSMTADKMMALYAEATDGED